MAVTKQEVAELYVATFNRAPDTGGLNFWVNTSGLTIEQIAKEFFKAPETQLKYPEGTTDAAFVNTIYQNVFGRDAEPEGLDHWVNVLGNGWSTREEMILTVIGGAQNEDADVLANKTDVGLYFADELGLGGDGPFSLEDVTNDPATVISAKAAVDLLTDIIPVGIDTVAFPTEAMFDADNGAYDFTDDAAVASNVIIDNFSSDDTISFANATVSDYGFSNDGSDVILSYNYNDEGTMNIIKLTGVVSSDDLVYDLASFIAAVGFDPFAS